MKNYFELYEIPISININQDVVKKKYYQLSKEYHPDFYITESEEKQAEILELSTINTNAFNTFKSEGKLIQYILELYNAIETDKETLPQDFLMEMMDLNEQLMELEFDLDEKVVSKVKNELEEKQTEIIKLITPFTDDLSLLSEEEREVELNKLKNYYLKRKYLLRIQERLNKFATH